MNNYKEEWNNSYQNRDNFLFYPHEEVIRFVSKYIRKRIGLNEFQDVQIYKKTLRLLDLGCGIGRHVIFAEEMGIEGYGIDLSERAISLALQWAEHRGIANPTQRLKQGDIRSLPWSDGYFNFVVSHGVLDSMHFNFAKDAIKEVNRVIEKDGLFYIDLISGDNSSHYREYAGEEIVNTRHEHGTVQSYFNFTKINQLIEGYFEILENILIKNESVISGGYHSRYHLILRRK